MTLRQQNFPDAPLGMADHLCGTALWDKSPKTTKSLNLLAHPTRFERVTFAFGGQRSFFEPNRGRSFRKPAVLIAQMLASGSSLAGFLALSPPKLRWRLFYPRRGQSGTLLCTGL